MMAVSAILIVLGILLIGFAIFYLLGGIMMAVFTCIFVAIRSAFNGLYHISNEKQIDPKYTRYINDKREKERIAEEAIRCKDETDKKREAHDRLIYSVTKRVNDLRVQYPLADEYLFNEFVEAFTSRTIAESNDIAERIKESHNSKLLATGSLNNDNKYSFSEVRNFDKIDEKNYEEITVTTYKNGLDYILVVDNSKTGSHVMYTTRNVLVPDYVSTNIINTCKENYINDVLRKETTIMTETEVSDTIVKALNLIRENSACYN